MLVFIYYLNDAVDTKYNMPQTLYTPSSLQINQKRQAIESLLTQDLIYLDHNIQHHLNSSVDLVNQICQYIIQAGGKRLRPMILILMYYNLNVTHLNNFNQSKSSISAPVDGFEANVYTLAAVIEFIHTATLLHDDVVDESNLRRNRATANATFGNAASVLVGDFLYSRAFQMMVDIDSLPIMQVLSNATNIIAEGEVQQLINIRDVNISFENYMQVLYSKTAKLFEAACELSVLLAFKNNDTKNNTTYDMQKYIHAGRAYGQFLGCAFQLMDDYLDYAANQQTLGKTVGDDLREGKMTLPLIYMYQQNQQSQQRKLIERVILQQDVSAFDELIKEVKNSQALQATKAQAIKQANLAKAALDEFPNNIYKQSLLDICDLAVFREY